MVKQTSKQKRPLHFGGRGAMTGGIIEISKDFAERLAHWRSSSVNFDEKDPKECPEEYELLIQAAKRAHIHLQRVANVWFDQKITAGKTWEREDVRVLSLGEGRLYSGCLRETHKAREASKESISVTLFFGKWSGCLTLGLVWSLLAFEEFFSIFFTTAKATSWVFFGY